MSEDISKHSSKGSSQFKQERGFPPQKKGVTKKSMEELVPASRDRVISKRSLDWKGGYEPTFAC